MKILYLFVLICCAGMLAKPLYQFAQEEEDSHIACDNSGAKDSASRYHNCACDKATKECDADHREWKPGADCKKYCREDKCECSTKSCS